MSESQWYSPYYKGTGLFFWGGMVLLPFAMVVSAPVIAVAVVGMGIGLGVYNLYKCTVKKEENINYKKVK